MKKSLCAIVALSGLVSTIALADPTLITIEFTCPTTTGTGPNTLVNFGSRIAGYGTELIDGSPAFNSPYFNFSFTTGTYPSPISAGSYSSSGTGFDALSGIVSCSYTSSTTFSPFTVSYQLTNAGGSQISAQTANTITLFQFLGVK